MAFVYLYSVIRFNTKGFHNYRTNIRILLTDSVYLKKSTGLESCVNVVFRHKKQISLHIQGNVFSKQFMFGARVSSTLMSFAGQCFAFKQTKTNHFTLRCFRPFSIVNNFWERIHPVQLLASKSVTRPNFRTSPYSDQKFNQIYV